VALHEAPGDDDALALPLPLSRMASLMTPRDFVLAGFEEAAGVHDEEPGSTVSTTTDGTLPKSTVAADAVVVNTYGSRSQQDESLGVIKKPSAGQGQGKVSASSSPGASCSATAPKMLGMAPASTP